MNIYLKKALDFASEVIFPRNCIGCETPGTLLCADCKNTILPVPFIGAGAFAACAYKGLIPKIFVAIKLRKESRYISVLGDLLIEAINKNYALKENLSQAEITFIPMHWMKQNIRGFNQSELLADQIAKHFDKKPIMLLKRSKFGLRQSSLDKVQRQENIKDIFQISFKNLSLSGKNIVLIDDIRTTGATLDAASHVLLNAGAKSVFKIAAAQD